MSNKSEEAGVMKSDIQYIKEAVREIKAIQKEHGQRIESIIITKWSIGVLWTWVAALTAVIVRKIW